MSSFKVSTNCENKKLETYINNVQSSQLTTDDVDTLINDRNYQSQITSLQTPLSNIQTQIDNIKSQLANLQTTVSNINIPQPSNSVEQTYYTANVDLNFDEFKNVIKYTIFEESFNTLFKDIETSITFEFTDLVVVDNKKQTTVTVQITNTNVVSVEELVQIMTQSLTGTNFVNNVLILTVGFFVNPGEYMGESSTPQIIP